MLRASTVATYNTYIHFSLLWVCAGNSSSSVSVGLEPLYCTSDHCWWDKVSCVVSSSIFSTSCSVSSSILSSAPTSSRCCSSSDRLSPVSLVGTGPLCRPRCLWLRRHLRARPFLLCPREEVCVWAAVAAGLGVGDEEGQGDVGEEGLDLDRWVLVVKGGKAAAEVEKLEVEVMAAGVGAWELEEAGCAW